MISIVSGIPRSGTSMMMQMVSAGGMPALTDNLRACDVDNPRGYFEWEPAKKLPRQPALIADAEGKAVKIISQLLFALPADREYQVIFMNRDLDEVIASQMEMTRRLGTTVPLDPAMLRNALGTHLKQVKAWLAGRSEIRSLEVDYRRVRAEPGQVCRAIQDFLGVELDLIAMERQVDPSLHRQRSASAG